MANSITKFKKYAALLDEVFMNASLTSDLNSNGLVREGANANEIVIQKMTMSGLANYDRASGYSVGDVTLADETVQYNYERGRMFVVDTIDNEESAGLAYGKLAGEFIRTKVVPEADAFTFATIAKANGVTTKAEDLSDGAGVIAALRVATNTMDEAEVPTEGRILYITPTLHGMIMDLDTTKSREVLSRFSKIVDVPQTRFYDAIDLKNDTTGGFAKGGSAKDINFMVVEKTAIIKHDKHVAPKVITPAANQDADAWKFGYRKYGLVDVYENKAVGVYVSTKSA